MHEFLTDNVAFEGALRFDSVDVEKVRSVLSRDRRSNQRAIFDYLVRNATAANPVRIADVAKAVGCHQSTASCTLNRFDWRFSRDGLPLRIQSRRGNTRYPRIEYWIERAA